MLKGPGFSVLIGSIYLIIYGFCLATEALHSLAWLMFSVYPFLLVWIINGILRPGDYPVRELDGEEFEYGDRQKDQLGLF